MLKKLKKNKKGFTLAELLIVVAIIGVLVAVSIPIFTSQLRKSKVATDLANERAAKAAAVADYLSEGLNGSVVYSYDAAAGQAYYNAAITKSANGKDSATTEVKAASSIKGYGQVTDPAAADGFADSSTDSHAGKVVTVTVNGDAVTVAWAAGSAS
jgi:prepilin-type N-terminal cleavage/methylation domain-containing protein